MKSVLYSLIGLLFVLASCKKAETNSPSPTARLVKLGENTLASGTHLTLYSESSLVSGYQKIFIQLSGSHHAEDILKISSLMDMGTMKHASPAIDPVYNSQTGLYEAAVVFTMPSGSGQWQLNVSVNGESKSFPVSIASSLTKIAGTFTATTGEVYVLAIYPYQNFKVGMNDFTVFLSKKETPMLFTPVDNLTLQFTPEMVAMGHSSPNNVNPVGKGKGLYSGKVNFTMTGDWRLHFKIMADGLILSGDTYLDITF